MITAKCPHCATKVRASDEYGGKAVRCGKCKQPFRLAEAPALPVAAVARVVPVAPLADVPSTETPAAEDTKSYSADPRLSTTVNSPQIRIDDKPIATQRRRKSSSRLAVAVIGLLGLAILTTGAAVWAVIGGQEETQLVSNNADERGPSEASIDETTAGPKPLEIVDEAHDSSPGTAAAATEVTREAPTAVEISASALAPDDQRDSEPADSVTDSQALPGFDFSPTTDPTMPKNDDDENKVAAAKKAMAKKPVAKRRGVAALTPYVSDAIDLSDADSDCKLCVGVGVLPVDPFRQYVAAVGDPKNAAASSVRCRFCPSCFEDREKKELLDAEDLRMEAPNPYQPLVEKALEREVAAIETHYATLLAPMDPKEVRQIAVELERLAAMLQKATGSMKLTPTRPDTFTFCIFKGNEQAQQLIGVRMAPPGEDYYGNQPGYMDMAGKPDYCDFPLLAFVVHRFAFIELQFASSGRAPQWLLYGFGSAAERAIVGRNHIGLSIIHYDRGRMSEDRWDEQVALQKKEGTLREWPELFDLPPQEYNSAVFQQAYSVVSFLFEPQRDDENRPKRFLQMIDRIADGFTATKAIEQSYDKDIAVLQDEWLKWIDSRG